MSTVVKIKRILSESNYKEKKLDKVNIIHYDGNDEGVAKFAKDYHDGNKGDYLQPGHDKWDKFAEAADKFSNNYTIKRLRSGFAGSGATAYTHKKTGETFHVNCRANGKTFYGTDHTISRP